LGLCFWGAMAKVLRVWGPSCSQFELTTPWPSRVQSAESRVLNPESRVPSPVSWLLNPALWLQACRWIKLAASWLLLPVQQMPGANQCAGKSMLRKSCFCCRNGTGKPWKCPCQLNATLTDIHSCQHTSTLPISWYKLNNASGQTKTEETKKKKNRNETKRRNTG